MDFVQLYALSVMRSGAISLCGRGFVGAHLCSHRGALRRGSAVSFSQTKRVGEAKCIWFSIEQNKKR